MPSGPSAGRNANRRLPPSVVAAIDASKILGIRAGSRSNHRFIGIWAIVVEGRVFVRSWTQKADGWYHTLVRERVGMIQVGERTVRVRAVPVRSARLRAAVERGYATKYPTPGSLKYVRGFRAARRRDTTTEFVPDRPRRPRMPDGSRGSSGSRRKTRRR